jgi:polynucleotide 5'-kinase involved in rRNA processing
MINNLKFITMIDDAFVSKIKNKCTIVIGASDTGKTTFIEALINRLSGEDEIAIVDLDIGQSHIGPPTTIAWGKIKGHFTGWESIKVEDFYFTGSISPMGNLVPCITGATLITEKARRSCNTVIIDTTGLISNHSGRILKHYKIELIRPDIIVAIDRQGELDFLLRGFKGAPEVVKMKVNERVTQKPHQQRVAYRAERLKEYFSGANIIEVSYQEKGIRFTREQVRLSTVEMQNRIISFRNRDNIDIALGIVKEAHLRKKTLVVKTPLEEKADFSSIIVGEEKIDL